MTAHTATTQPAHDARAGAGTRGVHHLVFTTEDMKRTCDFYVDVLGMPLVHAMKVPPGLGTGPGNRGNPPYENLRHYFFDMGNDSLLAFFELPRGAEPRAKRDAVGGMQHCAFAVTAAQWEALMARLSAHGVPFDGPFESLPGIQSLYFFDPNGVRLEACLQPAAGASPRVVESVRQTKDEAKRELETLGTPAGWVARMTSAVG